MRTSRIVATLPTWEEFFIKNLVYASYAIKKSNFVVMCAIIIFKVVRCMPIVDNDKVSIPCLAGEKI